MLLAAVSLLLWLGCALPVRALTVTADDGLETGLPLTAGLQVLRAPLGSLTDPDVLSGAHDEAFTQASPAEALDCRHEAVCWIRFSLSRSPEAPPTWWMHLRVAQASDVVFFGREGPDAAPTARPGRQFALNWRFASTELMFPVQVSQAPAAFYMRLSGLTTASHLSLWQETGFELQQRRLGAYLSVSLGVALMLLVANLIFWLWLKDSLYFDFALVMLAAALLHLWHLAPWLAGAQGPPDLDLRGAAQCLFQATVALFVARLFEFRRHATWVARAFHLVVLLNVLAMTVALLGHFAWIEAWVATLTLLSAAFGLGFVTWLILVRRQRQYIVPAAIMALPALVTVLARAQWFGLLTPGHSEGPGAAWLALRMVFMILLGLLVAHRTREAERELRQTRLRALEDALHAERALETKVTLRTQELAHSNQRLVREVERRRQAEQELHEALEVERQLVAQQRQFVAMASHEFRTPLAVIDAAAGSIDLVGATAPIKSRTTKIRRAVARLSGLIENFLAEDRMQASDMQAKLTLFDVREMARQSLEMLTRPVEGRLDLRLPPEPMNVLADRSLIEVALQNLAQNALKYSPPDQRVTVALRVSGGMACIDVQDQGPGIPQAEQASIFEKFYRGSTSAAMSGSGLGLYLVREIAHRHGGDVALVSHDAPGSIFRLRMLLAQDPAPG